MKNITIKLDEDQCPPLTEADFKKMRRYPKSKTMDDAQNSKSFVAIKKIEVEANSLKNSIPRLNLLAS